MISLLYLMIKHIIKYAMTEVVEIETQIGLTLTKRQIIDEYSLRKAKKTIQKLLKKGQYVNEEDTLVKMFNDLSYSNAKDTRYKVKQLCQVPTPWYAITLIISAFNLILMLTLAMNDIKLNTCYSGVCKDIIPYVGIFSLGLWMISIFFSSVMENSKIKRKK